MATGKTHDDFNRYLMLPASLVVGYIGSNYNLGEFFPLTFSVYFGFQVQRLAGPDSDQQIKGNYQEYLAKMIDPYFGFFLNLVLWPFSIIVPHRHFLSHGFLIGSVIRVLYLLLFFSPFIFVFKINVWLLENFIYFIFFFVGFFFGDLTHLVLDMV